MIRVFADLSQVSSVFNHDPN